MLTASLKKNSPVEKASKFRNWSIAWNIRDTYKWMRVLYVYKISSQRQLRDKHILWWLCKIKEHLAQPKQEPLEPAYLSLTFTCAPRKLLDFDRVALVYFFSLESIPQNTTTRILILHQLLWNPLKLRFKWSRSFPFSTAPHINNV